jgi:hypothetical protein
LMRPAKGLIFSKKIRPYLIPAQIPSQTPIDYRGGGELPWENSVPGFGTVFFPAMLRIVEFYLHKDSNYRQNPFKNSLFVYFSHPSCVGQNFSYAKQGGQNFPGRIFPRQYFSRTEFPPGTLRSNKNERLALS